jgi:hypothetical protein
MALQVDEVKKALTFLSWYKNPSSFYRDIFNEEPYPYQAKVLNTIREYPKRTMLMSASGTGKTKLLACITLLLGVVFPKFLKTPLSIIIISGSRDQARNLYEYVRLAFKDSNILAQEVEGEPLMSITRLHDRSVILAVPNSLKAIQGKHCDIVIIDEAVLAGDFIIRDAYRIVSQSKNDMILLSGTPMDEPGGELFVEMWEDEKKYPEWIRHHWTARECPRISLDKYTEASKDLPEDMFSIFWQGKPYPKLGSLIPIDKLKESSRDTPHLEYDPNGGRVVAGIDWGWRDFTALVILQYNKEENLVKILFSDQWNLEQFEDLHNRISKICKDYKVSIIYADAEDVGENQRLEARGLNVEPIGFNQNKIIMQTRLKLMFHQKKIKIPEDSTELLTELRKYNWDTAKGEDLVDALMLALYKEEGEPSYFYKVV